MDDKEPKRVPTEGHPYGSSNLFLGSGGPLWPPKIVPIHTNKKGEIDETIK